MTDGDEDTATATSVPINVSSVVTGTGSIYRSNWDAYNFRLSSNTILQGNGWYLLSLTDPTGVVWQEWQQLLNTDDIPPSDPSEGYFYLAAGGLFDGLDGAIAMDGFAPCTWQIPP